MNKFIAILLSSTAALAASQTVSAQYGSPYYPAPGYGYGNGYGAQPYGVPTGYSAYTIYGDGQGPGFPRLSPVTIQPYVGSPGSPVDFNRALDIARNCAPAAVGAMTYSAAYYNPAAPVTAPVAAWAGAGLLANSLMECGKSVWPDRVTTPSEYVTGQFGASAGASFNCAGAVLSAVEAYHNPVSVIGGASFAMDIASCTGGLSVAVRSAGTAVGAFDTPRSGGATRAYPDSAVGGGGSWSAAALTSYGSGTPGAGSAPRYSAGATIDLGGTSVFNTQWGGTSDAAVSDRKTKP